MRFAALLALSLALSTSAFATPKVVKKVPPEFPAEASKKGISSGVVTAELAIDPDGKVSKVTVLTAEPKRVFDRAVSQALMDWRFEPTAEKQTHEVRLVFKNED